MVLVGKNSITVTLCTDSYNEICLNWGEGVREGVYCFTHMCGGSS